MMVASYFVKTNESNKDSNFNYMRLCRRCGEIKPVFGKWSKVCKDCALNSVYLRFKRKDGKD